MWGLKALSGPGQRTSCPADGVASRELSGLSDLSGEDDEDRSVRPGGSLLTRRVADTRNEECRVEQDDGSSMARRARRRHGPPWQCRCRRVHAWADGQTAGEKPRGSPLDVGPAVKLLLCCSLCFSVLTFSAPHPAPAAPTDESPARVTSRCLLVANMPAPSLSPLPDELLALVLDYVQGKPEPRHYRARQAALRALSRVSKRVGSLARQRLVETAHVVVKSDSYGGADALDKFNSPDRVRSLCVRARTRSP